MTISKRLTFSPSITVGAFLVLLIVLLRLPNLVEPYWYGDEGIYLTIGNAMNDGAVLYQDIVDHKTPLIYYLSRVGSQLNFRILLMGWMIASSLAFYGVMRRLTKRVILSALTSVVFIIATSIPLLEGNIPNGELFVMGFVLTGLWIFLRSKTGSAQLTVQPLKSTEVLTKKDILPQLLAGVLLGLAILTKVPALFDAAAVFYIGWLVFWDNQLTKGARLDRDFLASVLKQWGALFAGVVLPLLLSVMYFTAIGAGAEYLEFGLLYNFHYVQNWSLGHLPEWGQTIFTLPVKAAILTIALVKLTLLGRWIPRQVRWALGWFYLALFASILSNRPYPHYILQVVPPLSLALGLVFHELTRSRSTAQSALARALTLSSIVVSLATLALVWTSLNIGTYPVVSYYRSFTQLATGTITPTQYRDSFNSYLADNYAASAVLRSNPEQKIFIWGTNPMLYALSGKQPVGRFTVGFHIQDLNLYQETLDAVKLESPKYIVTMNNEGTKLPGLDAYLMSHYMPNKSYQYFTLWRKRTPMTTLESPTQ